MTPDACCASGNALLVDTDILVDHLRGARPFKAAGDRIFYSVVTRCELFAGEGTEEQRVATLLGPFTEIPVDRVIAERGGASGGNPGSGPRTRSSPPRPSSTI